MLKKSVLIFLVCSLSFQVQGTGLEVAQKLAKIHDGIIIKKGKTYVYEKDISAGLFATGVYFLLLAAFCKLALSQSHDRAVEDLGNFSGLFCGGFGGVFVLAGMIKKLNSKTIFMGLDEKGITFQDKARLLWSDIQDVKLMYFDGKEIDGPLVIPAWHSHYLVFIPKEKECGGTSAARLFANKKVHLFDLPITVEEFVKLIDECLKNYGVPVTDNSEIVLENNK